jgi:small ligand-binding sensory domain FIST
MLRAGTGFSENHSIDKAAVEATKQALERGGLTRADTLLVFATLKESTKWGTILKKLKSLAGTDRVVGSSAFGVLTDQAEIEQKAGVAVMALEGDKDAFFPFLIPNLQENNFLAGTHLAHTLRDASFEPSLLMVLPDAYSFQQGPFFDGFESETSFVPLVGGCASEPGGEEKTFQWLGDRLSIDSVAGLAFGECFDFEIGITQSCSPLGEPFRITRSQGNTIHEIDGRPAYDIFLELITHLHLEDTREVFHRLFLGLPLTSFQTEFTRARYLVRNIMGVNARRGTLACASHVEQGDYVTFALRDPLKAKEDLVLMLQDMKERAAGRKPVFGLYFNCCARGMSLYGTSGEDTTLLHEYFPHLPVAGFFTFGEIAPIEQVNHLHHYSGVFALGFEKS